MEHNGPLRLLAFDPDDLAVISTHLQDAEILPSDMAFLPQEKRFALIADRYDRCGALRGDKRRFRTGLHFERVTAVRQSHFDRSSAMPATLVAVHFIAGESPGGTIHLSFDGGAAIRLSVEVLEGAMSDLDAGRTCTCLPAERS